MRTDQHQEKKIAIMEKCFACYAKNGLTGTGVKALAEACGCTQGNLYSYFKNLDELIVESTAYCMSKVEDEFMAKAPTDPVDVMRFIEEVPYWTAREHGDKYRLMYRFIPTRNTSNTAKIFRGRQCPLYRIRQRAGTQARHPVYGDYPAYFYFRPRLRALRHVRGRILPEKARWRF